DGGTSARHLGRASRRTRVAAVLSWDVCTAFGEPMLNTSEASPWPPLPPGPTQAQEQAHRCAEAYEFADPQRREPCEHARERRARRRAGPAEPAEPAEPAAPAHRGAIMLGAMPSGPLRGCEPSAAPARQRSSDGPNVVRGHRPPRAEQRAPSTEVRAPSTARCASAQESTSVTSKE